MTQLYQTLVRKAVPFWTIGQVEMQHYLARVVVAGGRKAFVCGAVTLEHITTREMLRYRFREDRVERRSARVAMLPSRARKSRTR
jgi:hypothetical protein